MIFFKKKMLEFYDRLFLLKIFIKKKITFKIVDLFQIDGFFNNIIYFDLS